MPDYRLTRPVINGRKSAIWYAVWREGGRSHRASSGQRDKAAAEEWLAAFQTAQAQPFGPWSVNRVLDAYLDSTDAPQAHVSSKHLRPTFGPYQPSDLTQSVIDEYIDTRLDTVSESTVATELRYLRAALNWAHRQGFIDPPRAMRIPAGRAVRYRFFTEEEFDRLIEAADTIAMRLFMEIAASTASRPSKIYQLRWSDINTASGAIMFAPGTSTKRTRPVPINYRLRWVLGVAYQARQGDYIIERNGRGVKSLAKQFRATRERAGVKDAYLRDFRGTAASWALQRGAPIALVADLLGDSVEVVERHYGHFAPAHIQSVTDLLG